MQIKGKTRQVSHVPKWLVIYHDNLVLSNGLKELTSSNLGNRKCNLHHELHGKYDKIFNSKNHKMFKILW